MLWQLIDLLQLEYSTEWIEKKLMYLSDAYELAVCEIDGDLQQVENKIKTFLQAFNV